MHMAGLAGPLSHLMRPLRAFASTGGLIVACLAVPSVSQAATVNLDYAGNPVYCSGSCLDATHTSAGTVEVTVVGNNLHFDVDLASGFTFMANHNTTFAFGLDVTGASITNIVSTPGGSWTPQTSVNAGDGVTLNNNPPANTLWPY